VTEIWGPEETLEKLEWEQYEWIQGHAGRVDVIDEDIL